MPLVKLLFAFCCSHSYDWNKQRRKVWLPVLQAGHCATLPPNKGERCQEWRTRADGEEKRSSIPGATEQGHNSPERGGEGAGRHSLNPCVEPASFLTVGSGGRSRAPWPTALHMMSGLEGASESQLVRDGPGPGSQVLSVQPGALAVHPAGHWLQDLTAPPCVCSDLRPRDRSVS